MTFYLSSDFMRFHQISSFMRFHEISSDFSRFHEISCNLLRDSCCMVNMVSAVACCSTVQIKVRVGPCTATWVQLWQHLSIHRDPQGNSGVVHGAVWCATFANTMASWRGLRFLSPKMKTPQMIHICQCFFIVLLDFCNSPIGARLEGSFAVPACREGPKAGVSSLQLAAQGPEPGWCTEEGATLCYTGCWMILDDSVWTFECFWMSPALFFPHQCFCFPPLFCFFSTFFCFQLARFI